MSVKQYLLRFFIIAIVWLFAYSYSEFFATTITNLIIDKTQYEYYNAALQFFIYDSIKILLLLSGLVYVMGLLRANLNTQKVRDYLQNKKKRKEKLKSRFCFLVFYS